MKMLKKALQILLLLALISWTIFGVVSFGMGLKKDREAKEEQLHLEKQLLELQIEKLKRETD